MAALKELLARIRAQASEQGEDWVRQQLAAQPTSTARNAASRRRTRPPERLSPAVSSRSSQRRRMRSPSPPITGPGSSVGASAADRRGTGKKQQGGRKPCRGQGAGRRSRAGMRLEAGRQDGTDCSPVRGGGATAESSPGHNRRETAARRGSSSSRGETTQAAQRQTDRRSTDRESERRQREPAAQRGGNGGRAATSGTDLAREPGGMSHGAAPRSSGPQQGREGSTSRHREEDRGAASSATGCAGGRGGPPPANMGAPSVGGCWAGGVSSLLLPLQGSSGQDWSSVMGPAGGAPGTSDGSSGHRETATTASIMEALRTAPASVPIVQNPLVATMYGQLLGKTMNVKGTDRSVDAFRGIPFAKPPTGLLRYADPQPPDSWSSVREAMAPPPMCIQGVAIMENIVNIIKANTVLPPVSEDCLYLNVFTPADRDENAKLPVIVFIHGGGLVFGYASLYDGSALSAYEDVVMVSIQYRLGLLGFLGTGDKEARGNLGLLDQVAALQWIQDNIKNFGGDTQSVTIFGQSAGGLSVSAHILSPLSKGLFHRAIAESGVALLPNLMVHKTEDILPLLELISSKSGCELPLLLNCLKNKTEEEILAITVSMGFTILPVCVDGIFLPKPAEEILAAKESNPVPFMIGVNNHEFGWEIPSSLNISGFLSGMEKRDIQSLLHSFPLLRVASNAIPSVMEEYFGDTNDPIEIRNNFLELGGDMLFVIPALKTANYHRDSGHPVYFYEFQHRPSVYDKSRGDFVKADHGDELYFVLGGPFLNGDVTFQDDGTDEEKVLSKKMMKYWANFARHGDPNGPGLTEWLKYDDDEHYMKLNLKQTMSQRLKEERFQFWTNTLPGKMNITEESEEHLEL
ncbi:cocaine esterase-like isoform X2 [Xenopus laevis]|uniref:Cocaine esterase-like isoform X2 n=2 Tax=Xenopus laevis TaxID=8355 RepID=A0A1L8GL35_XENLA|nr:cocaine esterase-like isoform X2 [Xenopus laevis]OCT84562.1 hypothetical protein XELAEV_18022715mg [Xenopus laevis]